MVNVSTRSLAVTGMSCDHCASAVGAEIIKLPGVTGVDVDVAGGICLGHRRPAARRRRLREAVEEAGYEFGG